MPNLIPLNKSITTQDNIQQEFVIYFRVHMVKPVPIYFYHPHTYFKHRISFSMTETESIIHEFYPAFSLRELFQFIHKCPAIPKRYYPIIEMIPSKKLFNLTRIKREISRYKNKLKKYGDKPEFICQRYDTKSKLIDLEVLLNKETYTFKATFKVALISILEQRKAEFFIPDELISMLKRFIQVEGISFDDYMQNWSKRCLDEYWDKTFQGND